MRPFRAPQVVADLHAVLHVPSCVVIALRVVAGTFSPHRLHLRSTAARYRRVVKQTELAWPVRVDFLVVDRHLGPTSMVSSPNSSAQRCGRVGVHAAPGRGRGRDQLAGRATAGSRRQLRPDDAISTSPFAVSHDDGHVGVVWMAGECMLGTVRRRVRVRSARSVIAEDSSSAAGQCPTVRR